MEGVITTIILVVVVIGCIVYAFEMSIAYSLISVPRPTACRPLMLICQVSYLQRRDLLVLTLILTSTTIVPTLVYL